MRWTKRPFDLFCAQGIIIWKFNQVFAGELMLLYCHVAVGYSIRKEQMHTFSKVQNISALISSFV
mgnify:CR=1 FL=1